MKPKFTDGHRFPNGYTPSAETNIAETFKRYASNDPLQAAIQNVLGAHIDGVRSGYDLQQVKIDAIISAYERAEKDPNARIPSYLVAAIAAAK